MDLKTEIKFLDFKNTASFLSIKESKLRQLVFYKKIPHYKVGHLLRFSINDLENWMNLNKVI